MRKAIYYIACFVLLSFAFIAGAGAGKSIWGGVLVLVLMACIYVVIEWDE